MCILYPALAKTGGKGGIGMTLTVYYTAEEYIHTITHTHTHTHNTRRTDFWRSWSDLQWAASPSSTEAEREMRIQ